MTLREEVARAIAEVNGSPNVSDWLIDADAAIALIVERCAGVGSAAVPGGDPYDVVYDAIRQLKGEQA